MAEVKRTFHYNACAQAFSGHFERPVQHDIEVQAPVSLPTIRSKLGIRTFRGVNTRITRKFFIPRCRRRPSRD